MQKRIVLIICMLWMTACANTPVERQDATTKALIELREEMMATRTQIDKTSESLRSLLTSPEGQVRDAYSKFAKNADTVAKQVSNLEEESDRMRRRSEGWLSAWKDTYGDIKNPELKTITQEQRERVLSRLYAVEGSFGAVRQSLPPFVTTSQDIKKAAGTELTRQNIEMISKAGAIQNAFQGGDAATRALDVAVTDLQALIDSLAPLPR